MLDAHSWRLGRVGVLLRAPSFTGFIWPYCLCMTLYYWLFASRFLKQDIVMGGDTQGLWSFFYFNISSLVNFHEFAWWDPTAFNGWPAYYYATSVYVSYLSPYSVLALAILEFRSRSISMIRLRSARSPERLAPSCATADAA